MLMFYMLTNSQHVQVPILGPVWNIFYFYSMSEAMTLGKAMSIANIICTKTRKDSCRVTASRTVYPCNIHCRCIVDFLCGMEDAMCGKTALCLQCCCIAINSFENYIKTNLVYCRVCSNSRILFARVVNACINALNHKRKVMTTITL